ncbi:MAG: hypothetical protein LH606_07590 [Cytophagaceae bacterium]|nr:hypothetical protein [Cytophagaceae bacterium]
MKKTFWLSYDLGLKGDYPGLYAWLDSYQAEECGYGLAVFKFECQTNDPVIEIDAELRKRVQFDETKDRVYLIWRDNEKSVNAGKFLVGRRKAAPWEGYAVSEGESKIDYAD